MPGIPNTVSVSTAPPSSSPMSSPASVTNGVTAARSPWRHTTRRSLSPFARAVRT